VLYQLSYLGTSRYSKRVTPVVLLAILVALVLAGLAGFFGLRLATGRGSGSDTTTVTAIFLLAITLSIVAIFSVTFIRKTVGG
jgi:hypothetical protein